jgi:hypothetical protein
MDGPNETTSPPRTPPQPPVSHPPPDLVLLRTKVHDDLWRFLGYFYVAGISLQFRALVDFDYSNHVAAIGFHPSRLTISLIILLVWDFASSAVILKIVPYPSPSFVTFIVHVVQVGCLAIATAFSFNPTPAIDIGTDNPYMLVVVYCVLMLLWNALYLRRHSEGLATFMKRLARATGYPQVWRVLVTTKAFFVPAMFISSAMLVFIVDRQWADGMWLFLMLYMGLRMIGDMVAMFFLLSPLKSRPRMGTAYGP